MDKFRNTFRFLLDKYLILFLLLFSFLTLLPYISFFNILNINNSQGIIYRGILLVLISIFFVLTIIVYKAELPIYTWIFTGLYFISQIVTIFVSPIIKSSNIPTLLTIMGLAQATVIAISVITYLTIHKYTEFDKKIIDIICFIVVSFGLFICIYSYIFEFDDIYNTFNTVYGWNYDVTSIFSVKTEYGFVLFVCSLFSIFYILNSKRYWMYCIPIFFLINMFISRSKTSILCTSIILSTLFTIHIAKTWNEYKKYWIITLSIVSIIVITLTLLTFFEIGPFKEFNYYITQVIFGDALVVLKDRIHKWSLLFQSVNNPFNIIFGYGERITPLILSDCGCASIGDNIYISNYGNGGLIKLLLYITLSIIVIIYTWKGDSSLSKKIICLSIQISFLVSGLFEDDSIVGITMSGLFSSIIFYSCNKIIRIH